MILAGVVMVLAAVLIVVVVDAAARGSLGINPMMGFRFGPLMLSDRAWIAGHKAVRSITWISGLVLTAGGTTVALVPMSDEQGGVVVLSSFGVLALLIAVGAWLAYRAASSELVAEANEANEAEESSAG